MNSVEKGFSSPYFEFGKISKIFSMYENGRWDTHEESKHEVYRQLPLMYTRGFL